MATNTNTAKTWVDENGRKRFVPLENNPQVFESLSRAFGVSPKLSFHDVYSIDEEMLAFVPRPAYALIFLCPGDVFRASSREEEKDTMKVYEGSGSEPVIWFKQIIGNACGLIAYLHSVCNGEARQFIEPDSALDKLVKSAIPLGVEERAKFLHDSSIIEATHQASATQGDSLPPNAEDNAPYHFISFVKDKGRLWELNGGMKGPLDRGELKDDEDCLSEKALQLSVKQFIDAATEKGIKNIGFSIVALCPSA